MIKGKEKEELRAEIKEAIEINFKTSMEDANILTDAVIECLENWSILEEK